MKTQNINNKLKYLFIYAIIRMHTNDFLTNTCVYISAYFQLSIKLQGRINAQGKLLLQDTFVVKELNQERERKVFLFEQSVVLAEVVDKKDDDLQYIFKNLLVELCF